MQASGVLSEFHADAPGIDQALAKPGDPDGAGLQRKGQLRFRHGRAKAREIGNPIKVQRVGGQVGEEPCGLIANGARKSRCPGKSRAIRLQAQAARGEARP